VKIRTKILLFLILYLIIFTISTVLLVLSSSKNEKYIEKSAIISQIEKSLFSLNMITQDYIMYKNASANIQWDIAYKKLVDDLELWNRELLLNPDALLNKETLQIEEIRKTLKFFKERFEKLKEAEGRDSVSIGLNSQLQSLTYELTSKHFILYKEINNKIKDTRKVFDFYESLILYVFFLFFIGNYFIFVHPTLNALEALKRGTEIIGNGNFFHTISVNSNDEYGELANDFNKMTAILHKSTISIEILNDEIEKRKIIEIQLEKAKLEAEKANKAKSIFLSNISHEIRTSVNIILGYTTLLHKEKNMPLAATEKLETISKSGECLLGLLNNVLDLAKIEAHEMKVENETFNLLNFFLETDSFMRFGIELKGLDFITNFENINDLIIKTDKQKLKQILINILGNATKFTDKGSILLSVTCDNKILNFKVVDTGIGIKEEEFETIFKPFKQTEQITGKEGTGLGLAICKEYLSLLDGTISLESHLESGTTFSITVPIEVVEKYEETEKSLISNVSYVKGRQKDLKILIVDDLEINRILLGKVHNTIGIEPFFVENGLDAIKFFEIHKPDLIWMDLMMPHMDGVETAKKIRELDKERKTKILGISAQFFDKELSNRFNLVIDDFIQKPFKFEEIYQVLSKHLGITYEYQTVKQKKENKILSLKHLQSLEKTDLTHLSDALQSLAPKNVSEVIDKINLKNPLVGQLLEDYAKQLKYSEIFLLIKRIENLGGDSY